MIAIKYKKRQFEAFQSRWHELLDMAAPSTDLGRGRTTSSMIPNLGHSLIREYLLQKYNRKHCIFTNCASDALDFVVLACEQFDEWQVPAYTWCSPVNAAVKSDKPVHLLDVRRDDRMLSYDSYDPQKPVIVVHADGRVAEQPKESVFVLEDAAQSPLAEGNCYGDATVLSFGGSKRMGLMGQGGCVLTDHDWLAERLKRMTVFGLDDDRFMVKPGYKSFFDPFNALCTLEIYKQYETGDAFAKINRIIDYYNECSGENHPHDLERYTLRLSDRAAWRSYMEENGIETRVWITQHAGQWDIFADRYAGSDRLANSAFFTAACADVPLNEFLTDDEVEQVGTCLRARRNQFIQ